MPPMPPMKTPPSMPMGGDKDPDDQTGQMPSREGPGTPNANYTGPENQCSSCQYFDGQGKCSNDELLSDKPDGMVDPAGRCDEWEAGSGSKSNIGQRLMQIGQPGGDMAASGADNY